LAEKLGTRGWQDTTKETGPGIEAKSLVAAGDPFLKTRLRRMLFYCVSFWIALLSLGLMAYS
jgi:hypothetical protein